MKQLIQIYYINNYMFILQIFYLIKLLIIHYDLKKANYFSIFRKKQALVI